jgi:hypothetical protein
MPRNEQAKSSTLRNRQRITNKTRLKVIHGPIDADPVIIGEDDDRGINKSTAGVDADDAAVCYRFPSLALRPKFNRRPSWHHLIGSGLLCLTNKATDNPFLSCQ